MKCRQCKSEDRFRSKFKKIRQNLMICTVCGYTQIKGLHDNKKFANQKDGEVKKDE